MGELVLVGVDTSDTCGRAVDLAIARVRTAGGSVVLATVIPWSPYTATTLEDAEHRTPRRREELAYAHGTVLAPAVERCEAAGVEHTEVATHGHPAQTLVELAQRHGATSVVVGRSGESRLKERLLGSVPAKLVQMCPVPVTVVP